MKNKSSGLFDEQFRLEKKGGSPPYDYVIMFKIVILQRYYSLSDVSTEYAILDHLSFMRFLGLTPSNAVPDSKTIWNFKNELSKGDMVNKLFKKLDNRLHKEGVMDLKKFSAIIAFLHFGSRP